MQLPVLLTSSQLLSKTRFIGIQGAKLILMTGEAWLIVLQNFLSTLRVYGV